MKPKAMWRTDLPDTEGRGDAGMYNLPKTSHATPVAHDNDAESAVLLYGPKGEALIRQEPRRVGFRKP
jgi:hypothetical protein